MLERFLQKLGLSDKEAKVYLAALELGQGTVQEIAEKARIRRPTAYLIIDALAEMGLVARAEEGKTTLYIAQSPQQLDLLLKKSESEITSKRKELQEVMRDFQAVYNLASGNPRVKFFEGRTGQIAMREEAAHDKDRVIYSFVNLDELYASFPKYEADHEQTRIAQKRLSRVIYTTAGR